jgi:lysozyme
MSLVDDLKRHEGFRGQPYLCSAGATTIGYGHNLDAKPLTEEQAHTLLLDDIEDVERELDMALDWFDDIPLKAQDVLVNMAFNLGTPGLMKFKRFLEALKNERYPEAADHMLQSKWATQVGDRATELAAIIRGIG